MDDHLITFEKEEINATALASKFGHVVIKVGDRKVIFPTDGQPVLVTPVKEQGNNLSSNDGKKQKTFEHGDIVEDCWVYVGVNGDGENVFAKGCGVKMWKEAIKFASKNDAHLGSEHELDLLQRNVIDGIIKNENIAVNDKKGVQKMFGGMFDVKEHARSSWAWSSVESLASSPDSHVLIQCLRDGRRTWGQQQRVDSSGLFTVMFRSEPGPEV